MTSSALSQSNIAHCLKVFISRSNCVFANLAFEEWLFRNHDISKDGEAVLIWSNYPTVVIGRYQNPWLEANLPFLDRNGIFLARRYSGGGAVYHDLGNLNISFFTEQNRYNRSRNLKLIADGLNQRYKLKLVANSRDDLLLQPGERKVSGTAARIAHGRAYHHLTLLMEVDISLLKEALKSPWKDIIVTNASRSMPAAAVGSLAQDAENISMDNMIEALINTFNESYKKCSVTILSNIDDDTVFPGVRKNQCLLESWEWIYGKTPKFQISVEQGITDAECGLIKACDFNKELISQRVPINLSKLLGN